MTADQHPRCEIHLWHEGLPEESEWQCGNPANAVTTSGCVHEHVVVVPVCAYCLQSIQTGWYWCRQCRLSGRTHACQLHVRRVVPL